jgi:S1-C subfamily serine protease
MNCLVGQSGRGEVLRTAIAALFVLAMLLSQARSGERGEIGLRLERQGLLWKIVAITPGGPAAKAGLRVGDAVVKVGNVHFPSEEQLRQIASALARGDVLSITILAAGRATKYQLTASGGSDQKLDH